MRLGTVMELPLLSPSAFSWHTGKVDIVLADYKHSGADYPCFNARQNGWFMRTVIAINAEQFFDAGRARGFNDAGVVYNDRGFSLH